MTGSRKKPSSVREQVPRARLEMDQFLSLKTLPMCFSAPSLSLAWHKQVREVSLFQCQGGTARPSTMICSRKYSSWISLELVQGGVENRDQTITREVRDDSLWVKTEEAQNTGWKGAGTCCPNSAAWRQEQMANQVLETQPFYKGLGHFQALLMQQRCALPTSEN